jgi:hypothetical protein
MQGVTPGRGPFSSLKPEEQSALFFTQLGVNTPRRIKTFEDMVTKNVLDDPDELGKFKNLGVTENYIRNMANVRPEVRERIMDPSEGMIKAHQIWREKVEQLRAEGGIDPAVATAHVRQPQEILRATNPDLVDEDVLPHPDYPITPTYVPMTRATGFDLASGPMAKLRGTEGEFVRDKTLPDELPRRVDETSAFIPRQQRFMHESDFEAFQAGAFRTDSKAFVDHIVQRARADADEAWKRERIAAIAAKDEDGNLIRVKNDDEAAARGFEKGKFTVVNDRFAIQWFQREIDHLQNFRATADEFIRTHDTGTYGDEWENPLNHPDFEALIDRITEADANAFVKQQWNAAKNKGVIVPASEAKYMMDLANLDIPYEKGWQRTYARAMNRWRTMVLTLMPRWWVNTAVGSALLNTIRGVDFSDYWTASKMQKAGRLPTGVRLGQQAQMEYRHSAALGYQRQIMPTVPTRSILNMVQGIENYFRQAAFVHNLKREGRLERDRRGTVVDVDEPAAQALEDIGEQLTQHYDEVLGRRDGNVAEALEDPRVIERAIQETDKFSYNYAILGPTERRTVRQFIPFWGWYKFISMAAYRLPVEMPGRTNAMRLLSNIAAEQEAENFDVLPEWVKGTIPISLGGGKYTYLSTMGMNPFAQFFNPAGPQGPVMGTLQPGQFAPLIQAIAQGVGFDPLTGDASRISPEEGIGRSFLDRLVNEKGEPVKVGQHAAGRRFLSALIRGLPQYRMGAQPATGEFPESISLPAPLPAGPLSRPYPGEAKEPVLGDPFLQRFAEWFGAAPKQWDTTDQILMQKEGEYVRRRRLREAVRARNSG